MKGINKCIFVGTLGADPEVRYTQNKLAIANFSIAITETWKDKDTGNQEKKTEWIKLTCFGKQAEIAGEYLKKGSKVYVEGKMKTRKWHDEKIGVDRYITEVHIDSFQMLDSKPSEGKDTYSKESYKPEGTAQGADTNFDDDIPF